MKYSLTQKLSHEELWKSWRKERRESKYTYFLYAFTPMGIGSISRIGEHALWSVEPSWADRYLTVLSEDIAIQELVESYMETERRVVEAYVKRLKVNLGLPDEHGDVWTPVGGYTIHRGVVGIDLVRGSDPTGEIQTRDVYLLSYRGRLLETNADFHVWEDKITEAFQYELMEALNLRKDEYE